MGLELLLILAVTANAQLQDEDSALGSCRCLGNTVLLCHNNFSLPIDEEFCPQALNMMLVGTDDRIDFPPVNEVETRYPHLRRVDIEGLGSQCHQAMRSARRYVVVCHAGRLVEESSEVRAKRAMDASQLGISTASLAAQLGLLVAIFRLGRTTARLTGSTHWRVATHCSDAMIRPGVREA